MNAEIRVRARFLFIVAAMFVNDGCVRTANVACTMEAKQCADGSYVGRDPARNCEFKPCSR
jgi:hypothetical protein